MHADWVKNRSKFLRRIINTLKTEEKELASKGIMISFEDARNELLKLLADVGRLLGDTPEPERSFKRRGAPGQKSPPPEPEPDAPKEIVRKSGYVIRKSSGSSPE